MLYGDMTSSKSPERKITGPIKSPKIAIQNIVVSADLHAVIDLYALSKEVKAVDYEPEQFPGAIFRIAEPKAVIILFKNGKMICTGTSTEANIKKVLAFASKVISKYVISLNPPEDKAQIAAKLKEQKDKKDKMK
jgi:transcription initiation factor TFIID TATA-box-binding protein